MSDNDEIDLSAFFVSNAEPVELTEYSCSEGHEEVILLGIEEHTAHWKAVHPDEWVAGLKDLSGN